MHSGTLEPPCRATPPSCSIYTFSSSTWDARCAARAGRRVRRVLSFPGASAGAPQG
jgi:hypothetical protein